MTNILETWKHQLYTLGQITISGNGMAGGQSNNDVIKLFENYIEFYTTKSSIRKSILGCGLARFWIA